MTETESAGSPAARGASKRPGRALATYSQRPWLRCLLLVLFGAGVHIPALQGQLIWDDLYLARDNPFIKSPLLILEAFRHYLFPDSYAGHYRPVQNISYIFDYLIWNTETYGYHLSNVLWHVGSGSLALFSAQRASPLAWHPMARQEWRRPLPAVSARLSTAAFFFALLWVVHPVHSAAVDYISGRADSLAFFFACAGWLLYLQARQDGATLAPRRHLCPRDSIWIAHALLAGKRLHVDGLFFFSILSVSTRNSILKAKTGRPRSLPGDRGDLCRPCVSFQKAGPRPSLRQATAPPLALS